MNLKRADMVYLMILILVVAGLPLGISSYNSYVWARNIPENTKVFNLTGHTKKGWVLGDIRAVDVLLDGLNQDKIKKSVPVLKVKKGDHVVLKLTSSDVVHGFSLKGFNIFVNDGIHPGKPVTVSFTADKTGTFTFACNAICGKQHENMSGTIIVTA